ncbi:MBL fold metallo-hydrolase [Streptomyces sp. NPDC050315]|uniref:MBL fold metallo-hydrolase n=1 Tax=Streptomyces sp. NPDC050315 TaxID=3155039 RepID=UPI00344338B7
MTATLTVVPYRALPCPCRSALPLEASMRRPSPQGALSAPYTVQVADGVYAYIQPDGGWCLNNAGFIAGHDGTVVIDTAATVTRARRLYEAIRATGALAPRYLINTHHHGDHTYGNAVFAPEATVVGHVECRREMLAAGVDLPRIWPHVDWGDITLTPPSLTYTDTFILPSGADAPEIHLIHPGPAHTTNDTIIWLPELRTVFTGDLIFSGAAPFVLSGSLEGSLGALDRLRRLGATTIVPGHGPVCGPEVYDVTENYLRTVQRLAADGHAAGRTPLETAQSADMSGFAHLAHPERLVANLHRAYAELDGAPHGVPLPIPPIHADLVTFNHGAPLDCHA